MNQEEPVLDETTSFAEQVEAATLDIPAAAPPVLLDEAQPMNPDMARHLADRLLEQKQQPDRLIGDLGEVKHVYEVPLTEAGQALTDKIQERVTALIRDGLELAAFKEGWEACLSQITDAVDDLRSPIFIEGFYRERCEAILKAQAIRDEVGDVKAWAETESGPDASTAVREDEPWSKVAEPFDPLADMQELMPGGVQVPADSLTQLAPLEEMDVEKVLREQALEIARLTQSSLRDSDAVQRWAEAADFFNTVMAGTEWADRPEPLITRIQGFTASLVQNQIPV